MGGEGGNGGYEEQVGPVVSALVSFRDEVRAANPNPNPHANPSPNPNALLKP